MVGFVDAKEDIYNAAAIIHDGKLVGVYHKIYLPNYGVFDENRYFRAGSECPVYIIAGVGVGINICEDIWYEAGPATAQAYSGAEVIVNISASPYHFGRGSFRERMLATRASDNVAIFAYNNLVGGQDELVFDGNSMVLDEKGQLIARGKQFEEDLIQNHMHCLTASGLTQLGGISPFSPAIRFSAAIVAILVLVTTLALPM